MPLDRVIPAEIPSQKQMIIESVLKANERQKILSYTGLERGQILKDYAWKAPALIVNCTVVSIIADMVGSMLGPCGLDKMVVKDIGQVRPTRKIVITNDAVEFLDMLEFNHPVGRLLVDMAKTVDKEVGDGVASTIVLAGSLVSEAMRLHNKGIHPRIISDGYGIALRKALTYLDKISVSLSNHDVSEIYSVALTSIAGKGLTSFTHEISRLATEVANTYNKVNITLNPDSINFYKMPGNFSDSRLIKGLVIRNEMVTQGMPRKIENARIAVLSGPLVFRDLEKKNFTYDTVVFKFTNPSQIGEYARSRSRVLLDIADRAKELGINVLCTRKGIDEIVSSRLQTHGIAAIRRISDEDIERIARATNANVVPGIQYLTRGDIGNAQIVEQVEAGNQKWIVFDGCSNQSSLSILLRAPSEEITFEAEHLLQNAINCIRNVIKIPRILPGGGVAHLLTSSYLRQYSVRIRSRLAYAIEAFANALEEVPATIIGNAGLDSLALIPKLRALNSIQPRGVFGVDVRTGEICNLLERGIIDPLRVVKQSLISATEFAQMIIRVDQILYIPTTEEERIRKRRKEMEEKRKYPEDWVEERV